MLPFPLIIAASRPFPIILSPSTLGVGCVVDVGATGYAGILYNANGTELSTGDTATLEIYNESRGNWLDVGDASRVWIQWSRSGGTLADWNQTDSGDARLQCSAGNYSWCIKRSTAGTSTIIGAFNFYDAASGGNLLATTGNITFSVFAEIGGG